MGIPVGVQFNNPLNVRPDGSNWEGMVGVAQTSAGAFMKFDTGSSGWRCAAKNVLSHYTKWKHNTIATLIGGSGVKGTSGYRPGWAPPEDHNDTAAYIATVARATGFAPDAPLNFTKYEHLRPVLLAMAWVEQGANPSTWWNDATIDDGLKRAGVVKPLPKAPIIAGTVSTATLGAETVINNLPTPIAAPTSDLGQVTQVISQVSPYVSYMKYGLVVLGFVVAGWLVWRWWSARRARGKVQ